MLRNIWDPFINSFIDDSLQQDPVKHYRSYLLISGSILLATISSILLILYWLIRGVAADALEYCILVIVGLYSAPLLVRWTKTYTIPGAVLSLLLMFGMPFIGYMLPIYPAPFLVMFPIVPLVATFFVNARFGALSTIVVSIAPHVYDARAASLAVPEQHVVVMRNNDDHDNVDYPLHDHTPANDSEQHAAPSSRVAWR